MKHSGIPRVPRPLFSDMLARKIYLAFPMGRRKVFTLSYDDGNTCDIPLVEMMRKYGIKGTFHLNSGIEPFDGIPQEKRPWRPMTMAECVDLFGDDMEIAIHGAHHPFWDKMPPAQAMADILQDRQNLENATGKIIRGASYPYGAFNQDIVDILRLMDIQYCRTVKDSYTTRLPSDPDWLRLDPTCHHDDPQLMPLADSFLSAEDAHLHMLYVWGHTHELVVKGNWDVMEKLFQKVGMREDIWYATGIEIVEYLNAAKKLIYNLAQTLVRNPTDTDIWLNIAPENHLIVVPAGKTVSLPG